MLAMVPRRTDALGTETYNAPDVHALLQDQLEKGTADLREWEDFLIAQSAAREKTVEAARKCLAEEQQQLDAITASLQQVWDRQLEEVRERLFGSEHEADFPRTPEDAYLRGD